ncbi:MAG: transcription antitermination factor NusB [Gammaproteobacteria bacterium]
MQPKKKFNPKARKNARGLVLQALYQWQISGNTISDIEHQFLIENDFEETDREFFLELLHAIPAHLDEIQASFEPYLDRPVDQLTPIELAVLRIGSYELNFRPDIPFKVAINEALELNKLFGATDAYKFINGVLDKIAQAKPK